MKTMNIMCLFIFYVVSNQSIFYFMFRVQNKELLLLGKNTRTKATRELRMRMR